MITRLELNHFTVFKKVCLDFGRKLNVLIGENGSGKTQILKFWTWRTRMTHIVVDSRIFEFPDSWLVVQYDDLPYYAEQKRRERRE